VISDERFAIANIDDYLIVDVYLPCVVTIDRQSIVENILADICYHAESFNAYYLLIGGDFNCDLGNNDPVSTHVDNFARDLGLHRCDKVIGDHQRYTYVNDTLNCHSCIDYFLIF
jgi:hypothetical protein